MTTWKELFGHEKCVKCGKKGIYIVSKQFLCVEHYKEQEQSKTGIDTKGTTKEVI